MEFRVLGPLDVVDDAGKSIPVPGARQRALLAALLLHANETVARDRLMDELWGDEPPASGAKALQVAVSQLRKTLGDGVLQTRPGGYALGVGPNGLDVSRFERLREEARASLAAGDAEQAADTLRRALGLWRGPALADVAYETFARVEAERLEELRLGALEERIYADLARGRHAELVPELEALARTHPFRERLKEQLMLALYRSGRQAEALEVYRQARRLLADELGIEPSSALQELERGILRQEPELEAPARAPIRFSRPVLTRGRLLVVGGLLTATAAAVLLLARDASAPVVVRPNSVAVIDPATSEIVAAIPVGKSPGPIVGGLGSVWVLNRNDLTVSRIDPAKRQVVGVVAGGVEVTGYREDTSVALLAAGENALWTGNGGRLRRSDQGRPGHTTTIEFPANALWTGIATGLGHVWVPNWESGLLRIDPDRGTIAPTVQLEPVGESTGWSSVAVGLRSVWVANGSDNDTDDSASVFRYDPVSGDVATLAVEGQLSAIAVGAGAVWVTDSSRSRLLRIRPRPLSVVRSIPVGRGPMAVAVGAGAVWTANALDGSVSRVDPATGEVATIRIGHRPQGVAVAGGLVWVSMRS